jgi:hypothetical protein
MTRQCSCAGRWRNAASRASPHLLSVHGRASGLDRCAGAWRGARKPGPRAGRHPAHVAATLQARASTGVHVLRRWWLRCLWVPDQNWCDRGGGRRSQRTPTTSLLGSLPSEQREQSRAGGPVPGAAAAAECPGALTEGPLSRSSASVTGWRRSPRCCEGAGKDSSHTHQARQSKGGCFAASSQA